MNNLIDIIIEMLIKVFDFILESPYITLLTRIDKIFSLFKRFMPECVKSFLKKISSDVIYRAKTALSDG